MAGGIDGLPRSGDTLSAQALRFIQGERRAHDFIARLEAQQADEDELSMILAKLYGPELRGFVRVLTKALTATRAA